MARELELSRRAVLAGACAAVFTRSLVQAAPAMRFDETDRIIGKAIQDGKCPGAVLSVGRRSGVVYMKSYGSRAIEPQRTPMTDDTIFDMASLTKPTATATSIMLLAERGKLAFSDPVAKHLPDFAANGKEGVTIEHLLIHCGGLTPDNPMSDFENVAPAVAMKRTLETKLRNPPGTKFDYSDVGFITLGEIVRVVAGESENDFARQNIFKPLGMKDTSYLPPDELKKRCAPTEKRNGHWMIGEVHDPRAYALGGVAGHAGLFSTAADVSRFCRMILNKGELDGVRMLKESTVETMTTPRKLPGGSGYRTYGFDVDTKWSSPRGEKFPKGKSFGHTGFTGTSYWIDPVDDAFVVLLTNSIHPDGQSKKVVELRRHVATAVADVMLGKA